MKKFLRNLLTPLTMGAILYSSIAFAQADKSSEDNLTVEPIYEPVQNNGSAIVVDPKSGPVHVTGPDGGGTIITPEDGEVTIEGPGDILDIAGPIDIPNPWEKFLKVLLVLASIALIGFLFWLAKRFWNKKETHVIRIAPVDWALRELLSTKQLMLPGKDKEFSSAVSNVIRQYIEKSFLVPAPELTTEEFLDKCADHPVFQGEVSEKLSHFLVLCDLAKFAQHSFGTEDRNELYNIAEEFVKVSDKKRKEEEARKKAEAQQHAQTKFSNPPDETEEKETPPTYDASKAPPQETEVSRYGPPST